jgi:hypothetical protein
MSESQADCQRLPFAAVILVAVGSVAAASAAPAVPAFGVESSLWSRALLFVGLAILALGYVDAFRSRCIRSYMTITLPVLALLADKVNTVGRISDSASAVRACGGCAIAYPPYDAGAARLELAAAGVHGRHADGLLDAVRRRLGGVGDRQAALAAPARAASPAISISSVTMAREPWRSMGRITISPSCTRTLTSGRSMPAAPSALRRAR